MNALLLIVALLALVVAAGVSRGQDGAEVESDPDATLVYAVCNYGDNAGVGPPVIAVAHRASRDECLAFWVEALRPPDPLPAEGERVVTPYAGVEWDVSRQIVAYRPTTDMTRKVPEVIFQCRQDRRGKYVLFARVRLPHATSSGQLRAFVPMVDGQAVGRFRTQRDAWGKVTGINGSGQAERLWAGVRDHRVWTIEGDFGVGNREDGWRVEVELGSYPSAAEIDRCGLDPVSE